MIVQAHNLAGAMTTQSDDGARGVNARGAVGAVGTHTHQAMQISVREARLTLDRIFLAAGIPDGMIASVREHALLSVALGLGGWMAVRDQHAAIAAGVESRIRLDADESVRYDRIAGRSNIETGIDAGGQHAWLAGASLLDVAIELAQDSGTATVNVRNLEAAEELQVLTALGRRHGVIVNVAPARPDARDVKFTVTIDRAPRTPQEWDPVLHRALHHGLAVDAVLWWELHHLSNRALSPDTVESRRHAGPIIVAADGRIIGRQVDDETDVSLLRHAAH
jgi:hypothetical protein